MKKSITIALLFIAFAYGSATAQTRGLEVIASTLGGEHAVIGRQYAVLIAIDAYREWLPLKNPVKDAKEIRGILTARYFIDQVFELYDEGATKAGILRLFDTLIKTLKPEDSVLIYYAGHGQLDDTDTGFWIPVDAGTDRFEQMNWIPNIQVRNNIGKMLARHVVLFSDSCFSGDILNPTRGALPAIDQAYFRNALSRVSRQVLTSGASESVPDQSEFSQQLKLALRGNTQPFLDPLMLYGQIRLGMSRSTPLFGDLKDSGHQEGASHLLFLRGAENAVTASPAIAQGSSVTGKADLSIRASMEGAEVFVDGISYGKAPTLAAGLPSGRSLTVSARLGPYSGSAEVRLAPRELREISIDLERMKANLLIVSSAKDVYLFIDGEAKGPLGSGAFRDLPAGEVLLELKGEGLYYAITVNLKAEETTRLSLEPRVVGSVAYEGPAAVSIILTGPAGFSRELSGTAAMENLAIGDYLAEPALAGHGSFRQTITVRKGETTVLRVGAGRLEFDWLPPRTVVALDGKPIPLVYDPGSRARSDLLFAREYGLSVEMPGIGTYAEKIVVEAGAESRVPKLTSFALEVLKGQGAKRRSLDSGARISFVIGLLGAAGAGASYFLGAGAMDAYEGATITSDIVAARRKVAAFGAVFTASAIAGGMGLGLAPILRIAGPSMKNLESSIRDLEAQLEALGKAER